VSGDLADVAEIEYIAMSGDLADVVEDEDVAEAGETILVSLLALYAAARRLHEQAAPRRRAEWAWDGAQGAGTGGKVVDFRAALHRCFRSVAP
jgi:hypothetical protein